MSFPWELSPTSELPSRRFARKFQRLYRHIANVHSQIFDAPFSGAAAFQPRFVSSDAANTLEITLNLDISTAIEAEGATLNTELSQFYGY